VIARGHLNHMGARLLHYREWKGDFRAPVWSVWPIARVALMMIFRRRLFWALYAVGLLIFFMFFFGQYLLAWAESQLAEQTVSVGIMRAEPGRLIHVLKEVLKLNGTGYTYRSFFWYQGYMVMIILALAGSIVVGNDFQFGSLPFYLSKPLGRWHYLIGKCLAIAVFVNLMTTLPALALYLQYGLLNTWDYFTDNIRLFFGILAYGAILTVGLSLLLMAAATWLRRTVPMIMTWATLFFFFPLLSRALVDGFHYDARWRLMDLWNDNYLLGNACMGLPPGSVRGMQPEVYLAGIVTGGLSLLCLTYLSLRIRGVEIVK
jgi:ABC-2 type transport system permease protein